MISGLLKQTCNFYFFSKFNKFDIRITRAINVILYFKLVYVMGSEDEYVNKIYTDIDSVISVT